MRYDLSVIASWVGEGSRVLDLGCGEGQLLAHLVEKKSVRGTGIEMDEEKAARAMEKGLSVIHGDINEEILDYPEGSFDSVILSQTLQQVYEPAALIRRMLRVGKKGIVSFPNFAHWRHRLQLLFLGRAPVSKELPYGWHDTPNIRVIPIKDFRTFCKKEGFLVLAEEAIRSHHHEEQGAKARLLPNLTAGYGIFLLGRQG